ncbi:MAG TPA: chemotaxis protein CheA [Verrucomicrobiae bacterium]|nr:chemotaxis protein CheA [Verrucomicrobiae bacterium]
MSALFENSSLLEDYCEEAAGHLECAENALLLMEGRGADGVLETEALHSLLGALHTLKGNSGMMGFGHIQRYVHQVESVVKQAGEGHLPVPVVIEAVFSAVNSLRAAIRTVAENPLAPLDLGEESLLLEKAASAPRAAAEPAIEGKGAAIDGYSFVTQKSSTLKVNFVKLDDLLNLVGELVIHRTALQSLEARLQGALADRELFEQFTETSRLVGKSAGDLRDAIMKVRMLPVKSVFHRFTRLVRDLSRSHGKEVVLSFEGEETELDKTVIDEIAEPLLHLIRNAVDHGIESPPERVRAGKEPQGRIVLKAEHENNHIVITVEDDGRGIAPAQVAASAVAKGLIDEVQAASMSTQEALQLLFLPGFSTARAVTETSGRGIGLDVVKNIATSLNGVIEVRSVPGGGTGFVMKLPLTLAIISALMVEVAGEMFAIPLSAVQESVRVDSDSIHRVGSGEMIKLRDRLLPVHRLDRYFGRSAGGAALSEYVVVVESGEKRGGIVVGSLLGQQEIVIKGMDDYLGDLPGISGATVLGDGRVCLVVDVAAVISGTKR